MGSRSCIARQAQVVWTENMEDCYYLILLLINTRHEDKLNFHENIILGDKAVIESSQRREQHNVFMRPKAETTPNLESVYIYTPYSRLLPERSATDTNSDEAPQVPKYTEMHVEIGTENKTILQPRVIQISLS